MKVIAGTGYYVAASQRQDFHEEPVENMVTSMREEIVEGCKEAPEVRCGIIGEIGCSWPLHGDSIVIVCFFFYFINFNN